MRKTAQYKAKRKTDGTWVEGYLACFDMIAPEYPESVVNAKGMYYDQEPYVGFIEVDQNTVSQCIGAEDINKKLMYENDIVRCIYNGNENIFVIVWDQTELDFKATNGETDYGRNFRYIGCCDEIEVVGNIFDNPELIKNNDGTNKTKKFSGMRKRSEINAMMQQKGMKIDKSRLEAGGDFIYYRGAFERKPITILFNVCNGAFYIYDIEDNLIATHTSNELDGVSWYAELLNIFYVE